MSDALPIYTIGHSTRTIPEFVELLRAGSVQMVVDIRTVPRSRTNPQYNADVLPDALAVWQIGCMQIPGLGGLRSRSKTVAPEVNDYWTNKSFHNYADYTQSEAFRAGLAQLLEISTERRTAIMCAEAVWWRCHRRIVADYLLLEGRNVVHIMEGPRLAPATMTSAAVRDGQFLHYPAHEPS